VWTSEEAPLKWEYQSAQSSYARQFLGNQKGCVLALPADVPEKYYQMFEGQASWFYFAERDDVIYRRLERKTVHRLGKDIMVRFGDFFELPHLLSGTKRIVIMDFDTCGNYSDDYFWNFQEIFRSGRLAQRSVLRWTFCPRRQGNEVIMRGVAKIVRAAQVAGYQVSQLPATHYAETRSGVKGAPIISGQMHLTKEK
jgi:hypothetical protein